MANYNGSCTGAMLDKAGEMAQSIEMGRVSVRIPGNERIAAKILPLTLAHSNPKIFLQLTLGSNTPDEPKTYSIYAFTRKSVPNSYEVVLNRTSGVTGEETVFVDYLVIDEPENA